MDQAKLYRVAHAAEAEGINRSTLVTAVRNGQCTSYETACGLPLVLLADVRKWWAARKPAGRPKKPEVK
ncbi:MAG: hypothetical protein AAGJ46_21175 [Planctomycetota bacterium]